MSFYSKLLPALFKALLLLRNSRAAGKHALFQTGESSHRLSFTAQRSTGLEDNLAFFLPEHYCS